MREPHTTQKPICGGPESRTKEVYGIALQAVMSSYIGETSITLSLVDVLSFLRVMVKGQAQKSVSPSAVKGKARVTMETPAKE
jgi:hypothetical protein